MTTDNQRLIEAIALHLEGGQVQHDSQGAWEWRGLLHGQSTRVRADGAHCRVQVEARNPLGSFRLQWSPKYVPDPGAVDDDAFDVADEVRVWVGHCVVIQCFGLELEEQIAGFRSFPAQGSAYLIEGMRRDHVSVLALDANDLVAFLVRDADVVPATVRFANLLAWTGSQIALVAAATTSAEAAAPEPALRAHFRCHYCRARYLPNASARCPQCGAPTG